MKHRVPILTALLLVGLLLFATSSAVRGATISFPFQGGTGTSTLPQSGQLLIGNSDGTYTPAYLTPGTNVTISSSSGAITINSTGGSGGGGTTTTIYSTGTSTGPSFVFSTSSETNLGLLLSNVNNVLTWTPVWIGTLADGRISSAATWNAKATPAQIYAAWGQNLYSTSSPLFMGLDLSAGPLVIRGAGTSTITGDGTLSTLGGALKLNGGGELQVSAPLGGGIAFYNNFGNPPLLNLVSNSTNTLGLVNNDSNTATLDTSLLTGDKTFTFPDTTGTFCLTATCIATTTGNWLGTFDGQEGTYYLARANHTGITSVAGGGTGTSTHIRGVLIASGTDAFATLTGTNGKALVASSTAPRGFSFETISGGGTPGGSNTQVQFNNAGVFGGDSRFYWDAASPTLVIPGISNPLADGSPYMDFSNNLEVGFGANVGATANGGTITYTAGHGGLSSGDGGSVLLVAGNARGASANNGGNMTFRVGSSTGSGVLGSFIFAPNGGAQASGILNFDSLLSSDKTFTFPNASGTIQLTKAIVAGPGLQVNTLNGTTTLSWNASNSTGTITNFNFTVATGTQLSVDATTTLATTANTNVGIGTSTPRYKTVVANGSSYIALHPTSTAGISSLVQFKNSHLVATGTVPTVSSCGTTPSIRGTDMAGTLTVGTGVVSSCTLTFAAQWVNAPACVANSNTAIASQTMTVTTSTFVLGGTAIQSDVVSYICIGNEP